MTDDLERLEALHNLAILDTPPEPMFDDIVLIAQASTECPFALISFVDRDRQWFKAKIGFDVCETPLEQSVCVHALAQGNALVIPDLAADSRTSRNPLVTGGPRIRFYAGIVLTDAAGRSLGTLCVLDDKPRRDGLTDAQMTVLRGAGEAGHGHAEHAPCR